MQVVIFEDPACSWCWAFQPCETAFLFEYGETIELRRVMGGLRDYPIADSTFLIAQWKLAARVSGMPFNTSVLESWVPRTTFNACFAVRALQISQPALVARYIRRVREALYTESRTIDDPDTLVELAEGVGVDVPRLKDHLDSGRAQAFFLKDREEAQRHGFGFPTTYVSPHVGAPTEEPALLQGAVAYPDLVEALETRGFPTKRRRRFRDLADDWRRIFEIRSRITAAELRLVTGLDDDALTKRLSELEVEPDGCFFRTTQPVHAKATARTGDIAV